MKSLFGIILLTAFAIMVGAGIVEAGNVLGIFADDDEPVRTRGLGG